MDSIAVRSPRTEATASRASFWPEVVDKSQTERDERCLLLILRVVRISNYAMDMGSEAFLNEVNLFSPSGLIQFLNTPADSVVELCLEVLLRIFAARPRAMEQFLMSPTNFCLLVDILDLSLPPVMRNLSMDNGASMNRRFMKKKSTSSLASNFRESSVSSLRSDVPRLNLQLALPSAQTIKLACAILARLCSMHETLSCKAPDEPLSGPIALYLDVLHRPGFLRSLVYQAVAGTAARKAALRSLANVSSRSSSHTTLVRVMEEENEAMFRFVEEKLRSPFKDEDIEFVTCLIGNLTSSDEGFQAVHRRPALVELLHELVRAPTPPPVESGDGLEGSLPPLTTRDVLKNQHETKRLLQTLATQRSLTTSRAFSSTFLRSGAQTWRPGMTAASPDFDYAMTLTERSRSPPISLHGSVTQRFWEAASVPSEHDAWKLAHNPPLVLLSSLTNLRAVSAGTRPSQQGRGLSASTGRGRRGSTAAEL
mmetsp:Transcript_33996/g.76505  ORF Transcript_33996/g.76505 Transcript_33996/m.76505 type:complete len:482 (+) Transcript_33996:556-2001(+)